jgi:DNA-binding transcriptional LysR family regulator
MIKGLGGVGLDLNQLQYFVAIAELQNISKASERLNISQPSLSKSISRLEKELGTKLFDRAGKRIILNDQGSRFLAGVQLSLQDLDDARALVENMAGGMTKKISLGVFGPQSYLDACLEQFGKQNPQVEFVISCNIGAAGLMETDQFDMMLYPEDPAFKKYKGFLVRRERFLLAVPNTHPFAGLAKVDPRKLAEEKFVFMRSSGRNLERTYVLCINTGFRPKIKSTTDCMDSHRRIIAHGLAVGFVAEGDAAFYEADDDIVLLDIDDDEYMQSVMVGFKREKHLSKTAIQFRNFVLAYFGITSPAEDLA